MAMECRSDPPRDHVLLRRRERLDLLDLLAGDLRDDQRVEHVDELHPELGQRDAHVAERLDRADRVLALVA